MPPMRRNVVVALITASTGCAQIAGIDETNNAGRPLASLAIERVSIGKTVERAPLDLTALGASFLVESSGGGITRVEATRAGDGGWTSTLRDPAPFLYTTPDVPLPITRLISLSTPVMAASFIALEHRDPTPAPENPRLAINLMLDSPFVVANQFRVDTIGSWTTRTFDNPTEIPQAAGTGAMMLGPINYDFQTGLNLSARPQPDRITTADAVYVLRYVDALLTGIALAPPFEQSLMDSFTATMTAVAADETLEVSFTPTAVATRYSEVRPATTGTTMKWSLNAAPGAQYGIIGEPNRVPGVLSRPLVVGPSLRSGNLTMMDSGVSVTYGNPFAIPHGWNTIFTLETSQFRMFTPPGATLPAKLQASMIEIVSPASLPMDKTMVLPAALPLLILLNGRPLSTDGGTISVPTDFVEVTFTVEELALPDTDRPPPPLYMLDVIDLSMPAGGGTELAQAITLFAMSNERRFMIPPETFQANHIYTLRAHTVVGGFPRMAEGDLTARSLPFAKSSLDSGVFTVTP